MTQLENLQHGTLIRIVDDDEDIRRALSFMLECKGWEVRAYESARDFLTQDAPSVPGCLLLDIRMPEMSGVELQQHLKARRIDVPVIFITGHADVETAVQTLKSGALDFLQKPVDGKRLAEAIESAVCLSLSRANGQLAPEQVEEVLLSMSPREKEITTLLLLGVTNKEIVERLDLSQRTVHGHRNNIYHKLRVHNLQEFLTIMQSVDQSLLEQ